MNYDKILAKMHGSTRIICIQEGIAFIWTVDPKKKAELKQFEADMPDLIYIEKDDGNCMIAYVPSDFIQPIAPDAGDSILRRMK
jgi:hypothetical protein